MVCMFFLGGRALDLHCSWPKCGGNGLVNLILLPEKINRKKQNGKWKKYYILNSIPNALHVFGCQGCCNWYLWDARYSSCWGVVDKKISCLASDHVQLKKRRCIYWHTLRKKIFLVMKLRKDKGWVFLLAQFGPDSSGFLCCWRWQ